MFSSSEIVFSVALLLSCFLAPTVTGDGKALESVPDLEKAMYLTVDGYPCVRLLNLTGEIGCSNPGTGNVVAPITRYRSTDDHLDQTSTILVSAHELQNLLLRVLNDQNFAKKVTGVLVESRDHPKSLGFSPAKKFPLAEFAPYQKPSYEWNPIGSGIMWNQYNFPVFLLSRNSTLIVQEFADRNEKSRNTYLANVAEFNSVMQTTKLGTHNTESCLKARTCLPLGGYSVWSSLPPINLTSSKSPKPLILAISSMDSASFFRDQSPGADSPLSGMISLLAALDALSHVDGLDELKKQLVFLVFTGEAWGYLGSRRFLAELDMGTDAVNGLNNTVIEQVLEIGSVGKSSMGGATTFFAHAEGDSSSVNELFSAMEKATVSLQSKSTQIKMANTSNPGIPPSSMMAFLRKNPSFGGIVLEEFDTAFANSYYHSHLDDPLNINSSSLVAAASLVARTLYILARDDLGPDSSVLNSINVNATLVGELIGCLLTCEPGLSCDLVKKFISPRSTCPNHYVGVFLDSPYNAPHAENVDDISRFVWNFLADRTSAPNQNTSSTCFGECNNEGEVCIGNETQSKGRCMVSSTRYVPAYSTRLKFEDSAWHVMPANSSDLLGSIDPVWTESYWNTIGLRVYTVQSSAYDHLVLLGGLAITFVTYAAVIFTRAFFMKAIKHD